MMAASEATTRRRVKLYILNEERQWDDKGTGHVSAMCNEQASMALVVISETDGSSLLESHILPDTAYHKQQETLIVWSEGEAVDLALSFQEKIGCDDIWEKICKVQGKDPSVDITQDVIDDNDEMDEGGFDVSNSLAISPMLNLPTCDLDHLGEIAMIIKRTAMMPFQIKKLSKLLERGLFLQQLVEVFHEAEDSEDLVSLHHIFTIVQHIVAFNKRGLYEIMFADNMLMDVVGMLEYNPECRCHHRDFLRNQAHFKQVFPLHNPSLVSRIHQTYRVQYITDTCLPPPSMMDENCLSALTNFLYFNKLEIIASLQDDEQFLCQVFNQLIDSSTDPKRRHDLALFVKEFCALSSNLEVNQKENFFSLLTRYGVLRAVKSLLLTNNQNLRTVALSILHTFVEQQTEMVKEYIIQETPDCRANETLLLNIMLDQIINDCDPELGNATLVSYMLRILLDSTVITHVYGSFTVRIQLLSMFFGRCFDKLISPLVETVSSDCLLQDDYRTALVIYQMLELVTFCVDNHTYQTKQCILDKDVLQKLPALFKSKHNFLSLGALRLFRHIIGTKEHGYILHIIKNQFFQSIIDFYLRNSNRYNLIHSALLDIFEFIRQEDISVLIEHVVESYWPLLGDVDCVATFAAFKRSYDQTKKLLTFQLVEREIKEDMNSRMMPVRNHLSPPPNNECVSSQSLLPHSTMTSTTGGERGKHTPTVPLVSVEQLLERIRSSESVSSNDVGSCDDHSPLHSPPLNASSDDQIMDKEKDLEFPTAEEETLEVHEPGALNTSSSDEEEDDSDSVAEFCKRARLS